MPKVVVPGTVMLCPHERKHPTWWSRDGEMGVCMMTQHHLLNSIKMLIRTIRETRDDNTAFELSDKDFMFLDAEVELTKLLKERNRRANHWS